MVAVEAWLAELAAGTVVTGPVLRRIAARLPDHAIALDPPCWHPRASNVARLAARDYAEGRRDDLWGLVPRYFRRSAAQEKYEAAQNADDG